MPDNSTRPVVFVLYPDLGGIGRPGSGDALVVAEALEQSGDQAPGVGHQLEVELGLGFDVEADLLPDQPVLGRPLLPLLVAVGGPGRVVSGEVEVSSTMGRWGLPGVTSRPPVRRYSGEITCLIVQTPLGSCRTS